MRVRKDAGELDDDASRGRDQRRRARRARCASAPRASRQDARADIPEYEIEAELLHEFRRSGAEGPAYGSIVAAGANACILHYTPSATPLKAGELCLIDAGCELDGYASDVTRTFPADGRFSAPQRELYDIVEAAQARRRRRDAARRAPARRARRRGARARAGHARHRPARPQQPSATSTR